MASDVGGGAQKAEFIAQPLHRGSGDEDAAFDGEARGGIELPAARVVEQPVPRVRPDCAGVMQHEAAGAVGVLGQAGRKQAWPDSAAC